MEEKDGTTPSLFVLLRQRWTVVLGVAAAFVVIGVIYVATLATTYQATAVIALQPKPNSNLGSDMLSLTAPQIAIVAESDDTVRAAARAVRVSQSAASGAVSAEVPVQTANVKVVATLGNASKAAALANAVVDRTLAVNANSQYQFTIIKRATPGSPSGPHRTLYLMAFLIAGLAFGLLAAALLAWLRPVVASRNEVEATTDFPVVGNVPQKGLDSGRSWPDLVTATSLVPSFNGLATVVRRRMRAGSAYRDKRVVVTSADDRDDAGRIAIALGAALARFGSEVLVIDADVGDSPIWRFVEASDDKNVAMSQVPMRDWRKRPTEPPPAETTMLLPQLSLVARESAKELVNEVLSGNAKKIDELEVHYDAVIIHAGSAADPVTDAFAAISSDALLVVRRGSAQPIVRGAAQMLGGAGVPVIGVIGIDLLGAGGLAAAQVD
jgi:capsular polysaccharide biosynthesis protein